LRNRKCEEKNSKQNALTQNNERELIEKEFKIKRKKNIVNFPKYFLKKKEFSETEK